VENHIKKHQKKPTVAMTSCSTLCVRMARAPFNGVECGRYRNEIWTPTAGFPIDNETTQCPRTLGARNGTAAVVLMSKQGIAPVTDRR